MTQQNGFTDARAQAGLVAVDVARAILAGLGDIGLRNGERDPAMAPALAFAAGLSLAHHHPEYAARLMDMLRDAGMMGKLACKSSADLIVETHPLEGEL